MSKKVTPGINPSVLLDHFTQEEKNIIYRIAKEWYVTNGGGTAKLGPRVFYRYLSVKPIDSYREMFNIEREIVVIFSPYENFEPRTFDAIDYAISKFQTLRIEKICSVIVSRDNSIEQKVEQLLKSDPESQIVIPFSYNELLKDKDPYFMKNRFKKHFYTRDLFAFESPLKKDLYFFGRNDLVYKIVNRHKANENSGLFGLRKTGKTSVIFGISRVLSKLGDYSVLIDCQNPSFHKRRWNYGLYYIVQEIARQCKLTIDLMDESFYTEENASLVFEGEVCKIYDTIDKKSMMLIFDEIENITFNISSSEHWARGYDFIYFWQTLRSLFQKLNNVFSYLIVGTNPMCIETPTILGKDNPIFNQVPFEYIPGFDVNQTTEMIKKLGKIMGLKFDEIIYSKLTEDYGGHPFLMRHICSVINRLCASERPTFIYKDLYKKAQEIFKIEYANYIEMLLIVLHDYYNDEYEMLKYLALGDMKTFYEFFNISPYYTTHLLGYSIVEKNNNEFSFKIETVKEHLINKYKYQKLSLSPQEMFKEISERRNILEPKLRHIVRTQLTASFGKKDAKNIILETMGEPRKSKQNVLSYDELFDPRKSTIYFEDLRKLILKHWSVFKNIFEIDVHNFDIMMAAINKYRADAHAKELTQDEMNYFRYCISKIEEKVNEFVS